MYALFALYGLTPLASIINNFQTKIKILFIASSCDIGWTSFPHTGGCYKHFPSQVTWHEADRSCKSHGGDLPSITDKATNDFLVKLHPHVSWIGLRQHPNEGSWTALGAWTDGSPWCFQNWFEGEPNDAGGHEDFAVINWGKVKGVPQSVGNGKWNDHRSNKKYEYFCQK